MDWHVLSAFIAAAVWEALIPGPSIALLVDTRARLGSEGALSFVAGITVANLAWVLITFYLIYSKPDVLVLRSAVESARSILSLVAVPCLTFIASQRILLSMVELVTRQDVEAQPNAAKVQGMFLSGLIAHALNPLSFGFYLASFYTLISHMPLEQGIWFGAIPIVVDSSVFTIIGFVPIPLKKYFPKWLVRLTPLLSGLAVMWIVGFISTKQAGTAIYGETTELLMLGAFLLAALGLARRLVIAQKERSSRLLWRVVAVWDSWFKVTAVFGAILGFAFSSESHLQFERDIRLCFVVAAVIASSLTFAKAFGELQQERFPTPAEREIAINLKSWRASEVWVGIATIVFLMFAFLLFLITDFRAPISH